MQHKWWKKWKRSLTAWGLSLTMAVSVCLPAEVLGAEDTDSLIDTDEIVTASSAEDTAAIEEIAGSSNAAGEISGTISAGDVSGENASETAQDPASGEYSEEDQSEEEITAEDETAADGDSADENAEEAQNSDADRTADVLSDEIPDQVQEVLAAQAETYEEPEGEYVEDAVLIAYADSLPDLSAVEEAADALAQLPEEAVSDASDAGEPEDRNGTDSSVFPAEAPEEISVEDGTGVSADIGEDASAEEALRDVEEKLEGLDETETVLAALQITEQEVLTEETGDPETGVLTEATLPEGVSVGEAMAILEATPNVAYVEPDYYCQLAETGEAEDIEDIEVSPAYSAAAPDDPYYLNTGTVDLDTSSTTVRNQYYLWKENFDDCWQTMEKVSSLESLQHSVTVAVLDSGCMYTHEDLAGNLDLENAYDVADDCPLTDWEAAEADVQGHGSHVCGILSAVSNNGTGMAGASANVVKILPIRVLNEAGKCNISDLVKAFSYLQSLLEAGTVSNLRLINMSLTWYPTETASGKALQGQIQLLAEQYDVLCVCAGGNKGIKDTTVYPSDFEECFSVTALTPAGTDASYSDYNMEKDISAYGNVIWSAYNASVSAYKTLNGTSMASPQVAAAAALLWSLDPELTSEEIRELLCSTAAEVTHTAAVEGNTGSAGALDIGAAVERLVEIQEKESIREYTAVMEQTEYTFTGQPLTPEVRISGAGQVLTEGTDYTLTYQDNISAGTATVTIVGIGSYWGSQTLQFTILPKTIAEPAAVSGLIYNGSKQQGVPKGEGYSLTGGSAKAAGEYTALVTPKENYCWSDQSRETRQISWQIGDNKTKNASLLNCKLKGSMSGSTLQLTWGKVSGAEGYDIWEARCGKTMPTRSVKQVTGASTTSVSISRLSAGCNYRMYVKAWRTIKGKKTYIGCSKTVHVAGPSTKKTNPKKVTASVSSLTLKKGKSKTVTAKITRVNGSKKLLGHTSSLRYWSSDPAVAAVSSSGKITAKAKGSVYVYLMAENGVKARITVTVP